jgi:hypothetical protein
MMSISFSAIWKGPLLQGMHEIRKNERKLGATGPFPSLSGRRIHGEDSIVKKIKPAKTKINHRP